MTAVEGLCGTADLEAMGRESYKYHSYGHGMPCLYSDGRSAPYSLSGSMHKICSEDGFRQTRRNNGSRCIVDFSWQLLKVKTCKWNW